MKGNKENPPVEKKECSNACMQRIEELINTICQGASEELKTKFLESTISNQWNQFMSDIRTMMETAVNDVPIFIPNGSSKKPYQATVPFDVEGVSEFSIEGLDETGLKCTIAPDKKSFAITGIPTKAGTFELKLKYKYDGCVDDDTPYRKLELIINPDPRDLWKNIPVDWEHMPEPRYEKENTQKEYVKVTALPDGTPQMDIVAASKRGRSHAQEGKPRDDHFKLYHDNTSNWYVITVADGAGSAKYSREGSRIACDTAVDHCEQMLKDTKDFENAISSYNANTGDNEKESRKNVGDFVYRILGAAALKAHKAINEKARIQQIPAKNYATTFLLSIAKKFSFGWFIASYWVGDGAICLYDKEKHTAKLMGIPDEGEYAGQTRFLTMPEIFKNGKAIYDRLRFCIVPDFTALFLMTDGVSDPMFETDANLNNVDKWDELWNNLLHDKEHPVHLVDDNEKAAQELLDWLDFWSPGNHDDRTIAILYKGEPAETPSKESGSENSEATSTNIDGNSEGSDDIVAEVFQEGNAAKVETSVTTDDEKTESQEVLPVNKEESHEDKGNCNDEEKSHSRNIPVM